jgi:hypothetical protein
VSIVVGVSSWPPETRLHTVSSICRASDRSSLAHERLARSSRRRRYTSRVQLSCLHQVAVLATVLRVYFSLFRSEISQLT